MKTGFKTAAFGGFSKREVCDYLDRVGGERARERKDQGDKIRELTDECAHLRAENEALSARLGMKESELAGLLEGYESLNAQLELIGRQNEELKAAMRENAPCAPDQTHAKEGDFARTLAMLAEIGDRLGLVASRLSALLDTAPEKPAEAPVGSKKIDSVQGLLAHIRVGRP